MGENSKEAANLDQILEHYVGGAGRYQVLNTIIMAFVYYAGWYTILVFINSFLISSLFRSICSFHHQFCGFRTST